MRKVMRGALRTGALGACCLVLSGCWVRPSPTFELVVAPATIVDLAQDASCLFLVTAMDLGARATAGPVELQIDASDGMVLAPVGLETGQVGELRLWGTDIPVGTTVTLDVTAERDGEIHTATATAVVTEPIGTTDDRRETGTTMRDLFIPWLASEHPELGIDAETLWTALPVRPHILEVSYYMFLSDEWELVVWWHVMIPPYDWARIYLRHRTTETSPSFGAEITSVSADGAPHTMAPPEEVWR